LLPLKVASGNALNRRDGLLGNTAIGIGRKILSAKIPPSVVGSRRPTLIPVLRITQKHDPALPVDCGGIDPTIRHD